MRIVGYDHKTQGMVVCGVKSGVKNDKVATSYSKLYVEKLMEIS